MQISVTYGCLSAPIRTLTEKKSRAFHVSLTVHTQQRCANVHNQCDWRGKETAPGKTYFQEKKSFFVICMNINVELFLRQLVVHGRRSGSTSFFFFARARARRPFFTNEKPTPMDCVDVVSIYFNFFVFPYLTPEWRKKPRCVTNVNQHPSARGVLGLRSTKSNTFV